MPETTSHVAMVGQRRSFYRSVTFQIMVVCAVSFAAPGMWDALADMGAGGAAEPYAVSIANSLVYALFGLFSFFSGVISNKIGLKYAQFIGAIGYPLYGAGLYTNNSTANTWFLLFGGCMCGISAGFLWSAQAAICMGYPPKKDQAFYFAVWYTAKGIAPMVGGAINIAFNSYKSTAGGLSAVTYLVFISVMCLGPPCALLLSPPEKVQRKDGSEILTTPKTWRGEMATLWSLLKSRQTMLLFLGWISSYFFFAFMSTWLTEYFTVRARTIASLLTTLGVIIPGYLVAPVFDRQWIGIKTRACVTFTAGVLLMSASWIWAIIKQNEYYKAPTPPVFDWFNSDFGQAYTIIILWQTAGQILQNFHAWLITQYSKNLTESSLNLGIMYGVEATGQAVAWAMQSQHSANHYISIGLNFGLLLLSVVPTFIAISELEEDDKSGQNLDEFSEYPCPLNNITVEHHMADVTLGQSLNSTTLNHDLENITVRDFAYQR